MEPQMNAKKSRKFLFFQMARSAPARVWRGGKQNAAAGAQVRGGEREWKMVDGAAGRDDAGGSCVTDELDVSRNEIRGQWLHGWAASGCGGASTGRGYDSA